MSSNSEGSLHIDSTLEDGAWLDSFDKLLEPRPVLRELNILKKEVHASFNRDSSVENSVNSKANESDLLKTTQISLNNLDEDKARKTSSISTPVVHRGFKVDPFKCSLSPIGAWRLLYFDKGKNAVKDRELCVVNEVTSHLKCTPVKPTITVVDYDEPDDQTAPKDHDVASTLGKKLKRTRVGIRPTNSRHVGFEPIVENSLGKTLTKPSLDRTNQKHKEFTEQRIPSLTLQPGKWRKSFSVWRRKQVEKRSSSLINRQSGNRNSSVEYIGFVGTAAGNRKSIYLKKELESGSVVTTPVTDDVWEEKVLERCNQQTPLPFEELYSADKMPYCVKIGEGAYGEVFLNATSKRKMTDASSTVMKIIPIEGKIEVNGEKQKTYEQVLTEVIISMELAHLRRDIVNMTNGFVNVKKVACVKGEYPQHFKKLWESFDEEKGSENDHPDIFDATQIYIVLELEFCGRDLESFQFQNAEQAYFALLQVILTLAVAEQAYQFEHRDLHWGNILILNTNVKELKFTLDNQTYIVPTKGVRATLIDYTLSRMTFDNCCHYNDISCDEELFTATGDYQFDIYRMMRDILSNNWETFEPRTNIFWISYVITKMVDGVQYKNERTKIHTTYYSKLENLMEMVLNFKGAIEYAKYLMNSD